MKEDEGNHERRNQRVKSALGIAWNKFKNRNARENLKTLVQAMVGTTVAGGMAVGAIGYAKAADAQEKLDASSKLGNTVITIPQAPDLTDAVAQAQASADAAGASADQAKTSAAEAKGDAESAKSTAQQAQEAADRALAAVPRLHVSPPLTVHNDDPPWQTVETYAVKKGTFLAEFGFLFPCNSQGRIVFGDGRILTVPSGTGFKSVKAIIEFERDTTATLQVDSYVLGHGTTTYTGTFGIFTGLNS